MAEQRDGKVTALLHGLAPKPATLGEIAAVGTDLRRAADGPLRNLVAQLEETGTAAAGPGRRR